MSQEINDRIKKIVCDVVELDPAQLTDDTPFSDVDVDSMAAIEIVAALEIHLGVDIDQEEISTMGSLSGIYKIIAKHLADQ